MITAAVVCPPAPLLIDGLAPRIADRAAPLRSAVDRALLRLSTVDRIVVVAAAPHRARTTVLPPGTIVTSAGIGRSDVPVTATAALSSGAHAPENPPAAGSTPADHSPRGRTPRGSTPPGSAPPGSTPPSTVGVGTAVGIHLLAHAGIRAPACALQLAPADPMPPAELLPGNEPDESAVGLLVMADGAACHGDAAPGGADPRSAAFDDALSAALRSGDPSVLAATCARLTELAVALRAETLGALTALAELAAAQPAAQAELLFADAPFGIGYLVASWTWA